MTCRELASRLMETPDAEVMILVKPGEVGEWLAVTGIKATGTRRNAVTFKTPPSVLEDSE